MKFEFTRHAILRMSERGIGVDEVERAVRDGRIIARYPDDRPYPSCLTVLIANTVPIHVLYSMAETDEGKVFYIITVYRPDPAEWNNDYSERRIPR
jgi:hypothetical protein